MNKELNEYFNGDEIASDVWESKYQVKDKEGNPLESTPDDMHRRLAKEFARVENNYKKSESINAYGREKYHNLSDYGKGLIDNRNAQSDNKVEEEIFDYFKDFKYIIPQGSIMSILGHPHKVGSLSNCFVVPAPYDSYGGILHTDEQLAQLMKRRGGVGTNLNSLRPSGTVVHNSAGTSTGAESFMSRYSNTTREVAQDGRRGALMLLMSVKHPDIFKFVTAKKDRTKVTGANISAMLTDEFMVAVETNSDFICTFPISFKLDKEEQEAICKDYEYNKLINHRNRSSKYQIMKIRAKELYDLIMEMAWENAEPGTAYMDRVINFSPDGVYELFKAIASNPCGEQWLPAYDSCRLFAMNFFSLVIDPFTDRASIDFTKLYEVAYMQQRLADNLIDLELERITAIIEKINNDPEPEEVKRTERELWENVYKITKAGRRTGCGFTGLGDMLAALGLKYDSPESMVMIKHICKIKMRAELDCTIDLAILRGTFEGWDKNLEFILDDEDYITDGQNDFYEMLRLEFPEQSARMAIFGRRNVSWSTVAPTGSLSILAKAIKSPNISSGMEPQFSLFYTRRRKVNPSDKNMRVDFVDQNGDSWMEYPIMMGAFKEWLIMYGKYYDREELMDSKYLQECFELSPWYGSTANDINWIKRVEIQAIIQNYTTNAISSTINLPSTATKEEVAEIYWTAWKAGLKGVTVYRDGCRTGVLVNDTTKSESFTYKDAVKRPKTLECSIHSVRVKGTPYTVIVGLYDSNPYEVFVIPNYETKVDSGFVTKKTKGKYDLTNIGGELIDADLASEMSDEQAALTRLISTSLRHGASVEFIVQQLNKTKGDIVSFTKAVSRTLAKYVKKAATSEQCPECKEANLILQEGCAKCMSCGYSKC